MSKKKPAPAAAPSRKKIGSRIEQITRKLTPLEREDENGKLVDLLGDKAKIVAGKKAAAADWKAKLDAVDSKIEGSLEAIRTSRVTEDVTVEEWLTENNEIVKIRTDTGEQLGDARKARAEELQEDLFKESTPAAPTEPAAEEQPAGAGDGFGDP